MGVVFASLSPFSLPSFLAFQPLHPPRPLLSPSPCSDAHAAQAPGALWEQVVGTIINFIKVASPTQLALAPEKCELLSEKIARVPQQPHAVQSLGNFIRGLGEQRRNHQVGELWEQVVGAIINFIKVASPTQLALAPEKFASLCHRLRDLLITHSQYSRGVLPLRRAISKVQQCTTAEHLTPQHADCLQLCLLHSSLTSFHCWPSFATLCHRLRDQLISHSQYARGVLPLRWAISKVQQCTTAEHLTPQHADCLQLCLLAKLYRQGGDLLQGDILDIDPKKTGLVHRDFLLYCFYGGTIYVGLKQYQKALDLFMHAITSPAQVVNAITVSAYKRHVLVSLILNAQLSPLPKFTPGIVQRGLKACCQDYHDLANIYVSRDAAELKKFVDSHEQAFKADNNLGLAHQVVASVPKRSIQRLTHTYLTLSLSDLAQSVHLSSPAEAEKYLLSMIADGEMFARIDQQAGMVSFEEDPEKYDSLAMAAVVEEHIQRAMKTSKKLAFLREHVSSN
ncbi:unnamed protein product [Closterium sp. NIES-65]|nr:unnamed protein product [Closterium sp. NIES-65]